MIKELNMDHQRMTPARSLIVMIGLLTIAFLSACKPEAQTASDLHLGLIWPEQAGALSAQLAVGTDGTVYAFDDKATLHAVAPHGAELWTYRSDAKFAGAPVLSSDGTAVHFLTSNNELISVGTDGKLRWTFKADDLFVAMPAIAPDGTVYLRTRSGGHRVSPHGKGQSFTWPEWTDQSGVAFDAQGQLALWDPMKKQLLILAPDGQVAHQCDEKAQLSSGPTIGQNDAVFYTLVDGTLVARDTNCQELWRYSLGASQDQYQGADYPLALGTDEAVYASGPDGRVQAIDTKNGQSLWASEPVTTTGALVYLVAGPDGTLYALSNQATLLGFRDGKQIWSHTLAEADMPSPLVIAPDGGLALIHAGRLHLFTRDASLVYAQPTPVPPPLDSAQAEKEIVDYLVDFIVQQEIGGTANYIRNSGQPWVSNPPEANIIVWAPANATPGSGIDFLQSDKPTRVWWYADDKLTETDDKLKSIEEYRQRYMKNASSDIWAWGYYEFGVISVAEGRQGARVYVGASCGPLCGHGFYYTLRRSPSGKWWITDAQHLWQS